MSGAPQRTGWSCSTDPCGDGFWMRPLFLKEKQMEFLLSLLSIHLLPIGSVGEQPYSNAPHREGGVIGPGAHSTCVSQLLHQDLGFYERFGVIY